MFQTLDQQIEMTKGGEVTAKRRVGRLTGIIIVAVVVFGGLLSLIFAFE
jgi:hypothetical protein